MNNKYVFDISVYSRPFAAKSFICLNLVFFGVNLCLCFVPFMTLRDQIFFFVTFVNFVVRKTVNQQIKKMQNEPNFNQSTAVVACSSDAFYLLRQGGLRNTLCSSSRLPAKTAYRFPTANKKMQNEPNSASPEPVEGLCPF